MSIDRTNVLGVSGRLGAGLVRAILAEMLGLSASALGSVQVALTGASDSGTDQPQGVSEGLKVPRPTPATHPP